MPKEQGKVKFFNKKRGFGFIARDKGKDIFVHYSGISGAGFRSLVEGDVVQFEVEEGPKGPQACKVVKINN